ncbi:MAG: hypothetical protein Hals2KO_16400 [Halioglobus sp.]
MAGCDLLNFSIMRTYINLTLLLILLMAGFGVWYLRSPLATEQQFAPFTPSAMPVHQGEDQPPVPEASDEAPAMPQSVASTAESSHSEAEHAAAAPVVLDLSLPADSRGGDTERLEESGQQQLPQFYDADKQSRPGNLSGRLMLEESEEGGTIVDGVEINISRPLR